MPFPLSIRGSIAITHEAAGVADQAIILACVDRVVHEGAHIVSRSDRSTTFSTSLASWGSNWRFTVPLSAGTLAIQGDRAEDRRVSYEFSTRRTSLIGTVMIVGLFAFVASEGIGKLPWWEPILCWLWLVGANYLIAFVRAPSWVRRRVLDAVEAANIHGAS